MLNLPCAFVPRRVRDLRGLLLALCACGLAGCATSEYQYTTRIADGQRLSFQVMNGRVENAKADGIEVFPPRVTPDPAKKLLRFFFALGAKAGVAPASVRVEDVSGERAVLLVEDLHPVLKEGHWAGETDWMPLTDPRAGWILYLDDTFRVYRFTIVHADGRTTLLHEPSMTSGFAKSVVRRLLGEKS